MMEAPKVEVIEVKGEGMEAPKVEVIEGSVRRILVKGEGLVALLGKRVTIWCMNYIYNGILEGVNTTCVKLKDAAVVYETGDLSSDKFTDAQKLPNELYIQIGAIESFMVLKK